MKHKKPYKIYPIHVKWDLWDRVEKAFNKTPILKGGQRNSYNKIITAALKRYFNQTETKV